MADQIVENNSQDDSKATPDGAKNTETKAKDTADHMIPKHRFDEVNTKYKEMQKQLDGLLSEKAENEKKATEAEKKTKEQQGKFEELYKTAADELTRTKDTHKLSSERVGQLESVINSLLEAKLENVPEEFRDLLPAHMTPEAKLEWLANAEKKGLFKPTKKDVPLGESTNPAGNQTNDLNKLSPMELLRAAYGSK